MSMMNFDQLLELVVIPQLKEIPQGHSDEATLAVMMLIAHESKGCRYIKQLSGPALGPTQIEPETHDSTWAHGDSIWRNAVICGVITQSQAELRQHPPAERLMYDLRYAVFMTRQRLFMKLEPLPKLQDFRNAKAHVEAMSVYLKKHWNTVFGAADDDSYLSDYWGWF